MAAERDEFYHDVFPEGFKWGLASSSYQTEGGWNLDGKGENIWDRYCHDTKLHAITDKSNGDVACDSYHKYKIDVQLLKNIGAQMYRFSISWVRILPNGNPNEVNEAGIAFYNSLINELLANGIEPVATIYHWDLPQALEDKGGWLDENAVVESFGAYSRICYQNFGDRVKRWITVNEPFVAGYCAYEVGQFAPGAGEPGVSVYLAIQNMLKAHAQAYHIYKDEFKATQNGVVGISLDSWWYEPTNPNSEKDCQAAERVLQFRLGFCAHPVLKGDYPPIVKECVNRKSVKEGRAKSRLPILEKIWIDKIKGSYDYIGLNHYTTELVEEHISTKTSWESDQNIKLSFDPSWPETAAEWQRVVPWGLRKLLGWLKKEYDNPEIIITENGFAGSASEGVNDSKRVEFYKLYINEVLKAVKIDGCNVTGYFAWSLLDVFEWDTGYTLKFGLHHVDFEDPDRKRTPKDSAKALALIFDKNGFPK